LDNSPTLLLEGSKFNENRWRDKAGNLLATNFETLSDTDPEKLKVLDKMPYEDLLSFLKRED